MDTNITAVSVKVKEKNIKEVLFITEKFTKENSENLLGWHPPVLPGGAFLYNKNTIVQLIKFHLKAN